MGEAAAFHSLSGIEAKYSYSKALDYLLLATLAKTEIIYPKIVRA